MVTKVEDFSYSQCKSKEASAHCHLEENRCDWDLQVCMCILQVGFEYCEIVTAVMRCTQRIMDVLGRAGRAMGAAPKEELWWVYRSTGLCYLKFSTQLRASHPLQAVGSVWCLCVTLRFSGSGSHGKGWVPLVSRKCPRSPVHSEYVSIVSFQALWEGSLEDYLSIWNNINRCQALQAHRKGKCLAWPP